MSDPVEKNNDNVAQIVNELVLKAFAERDTLVAAQAREAQKERELTELREMVKKSAEQMGALTSQVSELTAMLGGPVQTVKGSTAAGKNGTFAGTAAKKASSDNVFDGLLFDC